MNAARTPRRVLRTLARALGASATLGACAGSQDAGGASTQRIERASAESAESSAGHSAQRDITAQNKPPEKMAQPGSELEAQHKPVLAPETQPLAEHAADSGESNFCNALSVIQSNCQACHGSSLAAGAPMPLVTYDDFMKPAVTDPARKVYELVDERVHNQKRPMPPSGMLSSDTLAPLEAWVNAGTPQAMAKCESSGIRHSKPDVDWPEDCEDVYTIVSHDPQDSSKPYTIPANSEQHPWTTLDAPWGDEEVQLLATRPITDNPAVVHHWILWDAKEHTNLTFWAPGASGDAFPKDVGLYMPKGQASLGLDMHYYNRNSDQPARDRSGVELCVAHNKRRPKTAALYGLFGNATVPAMQRAVNATSCVVKGEMHLLGINPHMHRLGVHAHLELKHGTEPVNVLYDGPFTFEEQTLKPLPDTLVEEGDVLTTICTFENTTTRAVTFGEGTDDEMCINWVRYYPKGGFSCTRMSADGSTVVDPTISPNHPSPDGATDTDTDAGVSRPD